MGVTTKADLLVVFHANKAYHFRKSEKHEFSWFGGPPEHGLIWAGRKEAQLQHTASLWRHHLPFLMDKGFLRLPLFYGFRVEGCTVRYRIVQVRHKGGLYDVLQLVELEPKKPSENYPYAHYPSLLPYHPIVPGQVERISKKAWLARLHQPLDTVDEDVIILVPSPSTVGMSLWGPDAEDVQLVFRFNLNSKEIVAFTLCD